MRNHDPEKIEEAKNLYAYGYMLYQAGKYKMASDVFLYLTISSPPDSKPLFALGACLQAEGKFIKALPFYDMFAKQQPLDPYVHLCSGECLLRLGKKEAAITALTRAIELGKGSNQFDLLLKKATGMIDLLTHTASSAIA